MERIIEKIGACAGVGRANRVISVTIYTKDLYGVDPVYPTSPVFSSIILKVLCRPRTVNIYVGVYK